jgi:Poly A polymerase head domain
MIITCHTYADLISDLRKISPQAHIAGGAVRDTIIQKPIRDIDIFADTADVEALAARLRAKHGYVRVGQWTQYNGFSDPAMTCVAKFERPDEEIPVCIIGLQSGYAKPSRNIARFDFGICMAAFTGELPYVLSRDFINDSDENTFTLCRADNAEQYAYSMVRFERLRADRYQGWRLAIPEQFKDLGERREFRRRFFNAPDGSWSERDDYLKGIQVQSVLKPKARA